MKTEITPGTWIKGVLVVALAWYSLHFLTASLMRLGDEPGFIHYVHTVFHEAGHVLLSWAPPLLHSLAGTLAQWMVPLILAVSFAIVNRDGFSAAVCSWWLGQSLVDSAPYINDARTMQLTLLGGGTGREVEGHDWNFIFHELNLRSMDIYLARAVLLTGRIIMVLALTAAVVFLVLQAARPQAGEKRRS